MVIVYSTPTCAPCKVAKARLTSADVPFQDIDLSTEPTVLEDLKERLGTRQVQTPLFGFRGELFTMASLHDIIQEALKARKVG